MAYKFFMLFACRLLIHNLVSQRVHNVVPEGRDYGDQHARYKIKREERHFVSEIKSGVNLVSIHVVIGVSLETKYKPVKQFVLIGIPGAYLSDGFSLVAVTIDQPIMLDVLYHLHDEKSEVCPCYEKKCFIDSWTFLDGQRNKDTVYEQGGAEVESKDLFRVVKIKFIARVKGIEIEDKYASVLRRSNGVFRSPYFFMMQIEVLSRVDSELQEE